MNALTAFNFESSSLRVIQDDQGEPWFVAVDVCQALDVDPTATRKLDEDEKGLHLMQTPGGMQPLQIINESGLFTLILRCRDAMKTGTPAHRFRKWVTQEVLPAIRKTGSYGLTACAPALPVSDRDTVNALLLIGEAVARVPGVKPGIAMAATLNVIQENTGLYLESLRQALPALETPAPSLNPTQLGEMLGITARKVNLRLEALALQYRNERDEWALTEAGEHYAEAFPYHRNGHSGYQILWQPGVADLIREVA